MTIYHDHKRSNRQFSFVIELKKFIKYTFVKWSINSLINKRHEVKRVDIQSRFHGCTLPETLLFLSIIRFINCLGSHIIIGLFTIVINKFKKLLKFTKGYLVYDCK